MVFLCYPPTQLSVSSNGSNGLRQGGRDEQDDPQSCFQYPRTDRMGCDSFLEELPSDLTQAFSILERIEWAATANSSASALNSSTFSILERIEWAATSSAYAIASPPRHFQYPRTDRMGCDRMLASAVSLPSRSFSILERIEWAATSSDTAQSGASIHFQYPRTDRMGCDRDAPQPGIGLSWLSVSSNGSNGLRRCKRGYTAPSPLFLSVSSNGSNGLRLSMYCSVPL